MDCNELVAQYDTNTVPKTNLHRWFSYLRHIESPNSFIVFSFLSAVQAALQRRVFKWYGGVKCYPNDFVILIGEASLGKGMVIRPFKSLFNGFVYDREIWAYGRNGEVVVPGKFEDIKAEVETDEKEILLREARKLMEGNKSSLLIDDLLFPSPADSSTLRALSSYLANEVRAIRYMEPNAAGEPQKKSYLHSSIMLVLEDIISLFKDRRETKDMVDFLVQTWDAGNYKHATIGYGIDNIENCCVSMLGGTTPENMEGLFTSRLMGAGLSSRTIFIYEEEPRFRRYARSAGLDSAQEQAFRDLRIHIKKLAHVHGDVTFSEEAESHLEAWYEKEFTIKSRRVNRSSKLNGYYGRRLAHIFKLSMAIHFMESLTRHVTLEEVKLAMALLDSVETSMHKALKISGRNDTFGVQKNIMLYIKQHGPTNTASLLLEFMEDIKGIEELESILNSMVRVGNLVKDGAKYKLGGEATSLMEGKINGESRETGIIPQRERVAVQ